MPKIAELRDDLRQYISRHGLENKWRKAKDLFENDPSHPSLHTELLEPKHRLIYSFRLDQKYRAIFVALASNLVEVVAITKHYRR
jgi:Txe/YoeB family toxin of Txe-Axe toxin-antitoxin module